MRELKQQRAAIVDKLRDQAPYLDEARTVSNPDHQALVAQYNDANKSIWVEQGNSPESYREAFDQRDNGTQEVSFVETPSGPKMIVTTTFFTYPSDTTINFRQGTEAKAEERGMLNDIRHETNMHPGDDNTHINPAENGADLQNPANVRPFNGHMQRVGTIRDAETTLKEHANEQGAPIKTTIADVYDLNKGGDRPTSMYIQAEDMQGNVLMPQNVVYSNPIDHLSRSESLDRPPQNVAVLNPGELRAVPTAPTLAVVSNGSNVVAFPPGGSSGPPSGGPAPTSPGGSPAGPSGPSSGPAAGGPSGGPSGLGR
jgi:hypothetical protein